MTETALRSAASAFVASHAGQTPPALVERVQAVLGADAESAGMPAAEALLRAGERLLDNVLAESAAGREVALDLLAADACVTWAFEAAADEPSTLPARADEAMARIAELAK
jgi:hypothetical protein